MKNPFLLLLFFCTCTIINLSAQEYGLASVYDDKFHGRRTAYGFTYDKNKMTAAHKKHAAGTRLRVTRTDNNKSVVVTVNDKGPYTAGRIIDLSRAAAETIDLIAVGVAQVKVEVVGRETLSQTDPSPNNNTRTRSTPPPPDTNTDNNSSSASNSNSNSNSNNSSNSTDQRNNNSSSNNSNSNNNNSSSSSPTTVVPTTIPTSADTDNTATAEVTAKSPVEGEFAGREYSKYGLHKMAVSHPTTPGYGVQVMALNTNEQVFSQIAKYQARGFKNIYLNVNPADASAYKIIIGMYDNEEAAKRYGTDLRRKYGIRGFVTGNEYSNYFYKINLLKPELQGFGVQVMSLNSYENLLEQLAGFEKRGFKNIYISVEDGQGRSNYKIILGMFDNQASATRYKNDLRRKYRVSGFVTNFNTP